MSNEELILLAKRARENSYSPYSGFSVGAALECKGGEVFLGCNVENAGLTATSCAERTAIFAAVANGKRDFNKLAVVGAKTGEEANGLCAPCGVCRQVIAEFCDDKFEIILCDEKGEPRVFSISELLPLSFTKKDLD